jgi:hypothetical protein
LAKVGKQRTRSKKAQQTQSRTGTHQPRRTQASGQHQALQQRKVAHTPHRLPVRCDPHHHAHAKQSGSKNSHTARQPSQQPLRVQRRI